MGSEGVCERGAHAVVVLRGLAAVSGGDGVPRTRRDGDRSLAGQVSRLLAQALAADDAETAGLRADDVLALPEQCPSLLGGPDAAPSARHAVVQRYGRVGALLVVGYEGRWRARNGSPAPGNPDALELLLDHFADIDVEGLEGLLARLEHDGETGSRRGDDEVSLVRRRLHATYAVAARDGTDAAHHAYMEALERFMGFARRRLAS